MSDLEPMAEEASRAQIAAGVSSIRRARTVFLVALGFALVCLGFSSDLIHSGHAWFPLVVVACTAMSWAFFAYRPCPECGELFFVRGDPSRTPLRLRFGVRPFSSDCQNCGIRLDRTRDAWWCA